MFETLDHTILIGSTPTFLYFDLYLYSAYAGHCIYQLLKGGFPLFLEKLVKCKYFSWKRKPVKRSKQCARISSNNHTWFHLTYCYLHVVMCCDPSTENYDQAKSLAYVFMARGIVPSRHRLFPLVVPLFHIYIWILNFGSSIGQKLKSNMHSGVWILEVRQCPSIYRRFS